MAVADPIRDKKQLRRLGEYWLSRSNFRNYVLIVLGAHTALRIGDLLGLKWNNVYDEESETFRTYIILTEEKTGKPQVIALNPKAVEALRLYLPHRRGEYIFVSNRKDEKAISRVQAWRIIHIAAEAIKAVGNITCHSLRKTFGYFAWKMGILPMLLMSIFNHCSFETTRRYLGITQDDRDEVYMKMSLF